MFDALQQSGADFAAKQDMMENNYTNEMNIYNQRKQQINQYNQQAKNAARQQLNQLIGSDFAEGAIFGARAGHQFYQNYKTARQAREATVGERPGPNEYKPGDFKPGIGGDVKAAPDTPKPGSIEAKSQAGIASNVDESRPKMVTSGAQTDTPPMSLKGGGKNDFARRGALDEDRLIYDPNVPGGIKVRDPSAPGGFKQYEPPERELERQLDTQEQKLQETSVTRRAARQD